ncbi:MAG: phosphotransferase [Deltaproteobacteria bacterium]|nr:phosphotransferase [Deltaproteobacteria bacterium]
MTTWTEEMGFSAPMRAFVEAFVRDSGHSPEALRTSPLSGDGSERLFRRARVMETELTFVVMENRPTDEYRAKENLSYLMIGRHLLSKGIPVPRIFRSDLERGWFIMEDLGDRNLQEASREPDPLPLFEGVLHVLIRLQIEGADGFDPAWTCQTERYDAFVMRRYEAEYFRDAFLHTYLGMKAEWPELEVPFNLLAKEAAKAPGHFFLHRDFQSRNVMVRPDGIGIIDWQGGRLGPLAYDVASLIIDPYTDLAPRERTRLYDSYVVMLADHQPAWAELFEESFPYLALQRNLQILGAFSFLSKVRGKTCFEAYIPKALTSLCRLLGEVRREELHPLTDLVHSIMRHEQAANLGLRADPCPEV